MPSIVAEEEMGKSVALDLVRSPPANGKSGTSIFSHPDNSYPSTYPGNRLLTSRGVIVAQLLYQLGEIGQSIVLLLLRKLLLRKVTLEEKRHVVVCLRSG